MDKTINIINGIDYFKEFRIHFDVKSTLKGGYTRCNLYCHMVFYVNMVIFLITLLRNKVTNVVNPTYLELIQMTIYEIKYGKFSILAFL